MQTVAGKKPASHAARSTRELALELITYARSGALVSVIREMEAHLGERLLNEACDAARRELREREARAVAAERGELVAGARVTDELCPSCKGLGGSGPAFVKCPACKGSGRLSRHAVTYPRLAAVAMSVLDATLAQKADASVWAARALAGAVTCSKCGRNDRNLHFDGKTPLGCDACRIGPYVSGETTHAPRELEAMRERDQARAERDATHERLRSLEAALASSEAAFHAAAARCTELRAELEALRAGAAS